MNGVCPVCTAPLKSMSLYPRYVCGRCASQAASADGRLLAFFKGGFSRGFIPIYAVTRQRYDEGHVFWIDSVRCDPDEHRFRGIVIEVAA